MKRETIVDKMYDSVKEGLEHIQSSSSAASLLSKALANEKVVFGKDVEADTNDNESDSFVSITEEIANALAKVFEEFGSACEEFPKTYSNVFDLYFQNLKSKHEFGVLYYTQKVEASCFITRWWYKRKLQKEKDRLEAINDIIKKHNANRRSNKSPA